MVFNFHDILKLKFFHTLKKDMEWTVGFLFKDINSGASGPDYTSCSSFCCTEYVNSTNLIFYHFANDYPHNILFTLFKMVFLLQFINDIADFSPFIRYDLLLVARKWLRIFSMIPSRLSDLLFLSLSEQYKLNLLIIEY